MTRESYIGPDGATYTVATWHGESGTVYNVNREGATPEGWETVASYREHWRATHHAIAGCGCAQGAHYYGVPEPGCARAERAP